MSAVRSARPPSERACIQCRRRKTKCIEAGDGQACVYCTRAGKTCTFQDRPVRTPLTRKNLDDAEERCRSLEAMLAEAIGAAKDVQATAPASIAASEPLPLARNSPEQPGEPLTSPNDWNEDLSVEDGDLVQAFARTRDGMASLGNNAGNTGYLGNSSGNRVIESVASFLTPREESIVDSGSDTLPAVDLVASQTLSHTTIQNRIIDAYFTRYNSSYPILHEQTFREQYKNKSRIRTGSTWHIISFMVLAIGEWVSGLAADENSLYYDAARSRFSIKLLESGNISNVQAFLLMGNYLQKRDRPNTGFNFIGLAYRTALGLGLHREASILSERHKLSNHRRRVLFWILYCFDSGFSLTTGRPIVGPDSFIDIQIPMNVDDSMSSISSHISLDLEADYPTNSSALIAQSRLAKIANRICTQVISTASCTDLNHQTKAMEFLLHDWKSSLPPFFTSENVPEWFRGPRQMVYWKQANILIILLFASQKLQNDNYDKIVIGQKLCAAAVETVRDISSFCDQHVRLIHPGLSWYATYYLLQATLALSAYQISRATETSISEPNREEARRIYEDVIARAQKCLSELSHTNSAALRSRRLLSRVKEIVKLTFSSPPAPNAGSSTGLSADDSAGASTRLTSSTGAPTEQLYMQGSHQHATSVTNTPQHMHATMDERGNVADPSLHLFFESTPSMNDIFQGFQGFPSTMEQDDFAYQTASMFNMANVAIGSPWSRMDTFYDPLTE